MKTKINTEEVERVLEYIKDAETYLDIVQYQEDVESDMFNNDCGEDDYEDEQDII